MLHTLFYKIKNFCDIENFLVEIYGKNTKSEYFASSLLISAT